MVYDYFLNLWQNNIIQILNFISKIRHQFFAFLLFFEYNKMCNLFMIKRMSKIFKRLFGKIKKFRKNHKSNLNIFIVCVSIIMIWRGVWDLLDIYLFPNNRLLSCIICIIIWVWVLLLDDGKLWELEEEAHKEKTIK